MIDTPAAQGREPVWKSWPRAYLDTAELNEISRNRVDQGLLRELLAAFESHAVILVVSIEHLRDALKPGDVDAPKRLADALEQFSLRGLVEIGPEMIEPWSDGTADIKVNPWNNVRETLLHPAAAQVLAAQAVVQNATYAGDVAANASLRTTHHLRVPGIHQSILVGATVTLMLGMRGEDVGAIVDMVAGVEEITLRPEERTVLVESLKPVLDMVRNIGPLMDQHGTDRAEALRRVGLGADRAPGFWLAGRLSTNRMRNSSRAPSRSDSIDLLHASYYPYVDIATCDRQAYGALSSIVGQARGSRSVSLFRNGQLRLLLDRVCQMPTGEDLGQRFAT